jgi:MoaA/NifB/PqqE/SkfB family radical SAM enzyme
MPALRLALTRELLPSLDGLPESLAAQGVREVVVVLPARGAVPGSFRNAPPGRPDLPPLLDAVAPVQRFLGAARARGLSVEVEGFPPGVFDGGVPELPVTAMIEVSSRCNLRCPLCSVGRGALSRKGDLPVEVFERLVAQLAPTVKRLALHNLGEPLLHRELPELVRIAKRAGIGSVFLSTNLAVDVPERVEALARSGIDEIVCSLDAADPATYPIYRVGGRFEVVVRNLEALTAARRSLGAGGPRIRLQFLLFRHNEGERDAFRALARAHGVGFEIKVASAPPREEDTWLPADPALRRREREADHGWCTRPYDHTTVLSTGEVVPCCKDADGRHVLGDVTTEPFAAIWGGPRFQAFRERLRTDKAGLAMCRSCPGGWFLGSNVVEREEDPWHA